MLRQRISKGLGYVTIDNKQSINQKIIMWRKIIFDAPCTNILQERRYASSTDLQKLDKRSSRYASAKDLLELDLKGESDDDDDSDEEMDNNNVGDEMIDTKADEFIAKFYNQMKLQHKHSF